MNKSGLFCVKLEPAEFLTLDRLAKETERSKGAIIRLLLARANTPQGRRLLGEPKAANVETVNA
jgi:hypothetical protein